MYSEGYVTGTFPDFPAVKSAGKLPRVGARRFRAFGQIQKLKAGSNIRFFHVIINQSVCWDNSTTGESAYIVGALFLYRIS